MELLKPSVHLTAACYRDFRKYVEGYAQWSVSRRQATPQEKLDSGETRKGAVYFIDVTYKKPAPVKGKKKRAAAEQAGSNHRIFKLSRSGPHV